VQLCRGLGVQAFGQGVEHIGGLLHPAALAAGLGVDHVEGAPETERTVTHRQGRTGFEPACLQITQQLEPGCL